MTRLMLRLTRWTVVLACLIPLVTTLCSWWSAQETKTAVEPVILGSGIYWLFGGCLAVAALSLVLLSRNEGRLDQAGADLVEAVAGFSAQKIPWAILGSSFVSLFLQLAMIRWQATVFEFFAFYKNFSLLACFAGLGLGYSLAGRDRIPLLLCFPLFAFQFLLLTVLRFGVPEAWISSLRVLPFLEQLNMGIGTADTLAQGVSIYSFLTIIFMLTALSFVPIGQLCGLTMSRTPKLRAYGFNLLGSIAGVVASFATGYLFLPPVAWMAISLTVLLCFVARKPWILLSASVATLVGATVLTWPVDRDWHKIYTPYQMIELGYGKNGYLLIRAAGHYYQRVHNLGGDEAYMASHPEERRIRDYYDLAYLFKKAPANVAIVGAGTGNDVAAALRAKAGHVDAIEIDPAILAAGFAHHPEAPYADSRVSPIVNDARSFLRNTTNRYDMIVYGLLDSHTLLSHASSVRLDSFVYTIEGLKEARAKLKPDGVLSLSFSVLTESMGKKIFLMMQEAFDGRDPLVIGAGYDGAILFVQSPGQDLSIDAATIARSGFVNCGAEFKKSGAKVDVSTDDWPFFYMPRQQYPVSYLPMILLIIVLSTVLTRFFTSAKPSYHGFVFFLLGAGFMLVETKAITELGLVFGNTWQVIGVVIIGVLAMAFVANLCVQRFQWRRVALPFAALLGLLLAGYVVAARGGLPSTWSGRILATALLTGPMFFSGILFSSLLHRATDISSVMAMNLLGAMFGGILEYNSMYFGFRFLYLFAAAIYAVALLLALTGKRAATS